MSIPLTLLSKRKRRSGRVTINSCVDQLVALLEPIVQFYRITVVMELTEDATDIHGSEALIDGICLNLLMNSFNAFLRKDFAQPRRSEIGRASCRERVCQYV